MAPGEGPASEDNHARSRSAWQPVLGAPRPPTVNARVCMYLEEKSCLCLAIYLHLPLVAEPGPPLAPGPPDLPPVPSPRFDHDAIASSPLSVRTSVYSPTPQFYYSHPPQIYPSIHPPASPAAYLPQHQPGHVSRLSPSLPHPLTTHVPYAYHNTYYAPAYVYPPPPPPPRAELASLATYVPPASVPAFDLSYGYHPPPGGHAHTIPPPYLPMGHHQPQPAQHSQPLHSTLPGQQPPQQNPHYPDRPPPRAAYVKYTPDMSLQQRRTRSPHNVGDGRTNPSPTTASYARGITAHSSISPLRSSRAEGEGQEQPRASSSSAAAASLAARAEVLKRPISKKIARHPEFALWVGNVPADATGDEIKLFFDAHLRLDKSTRPDSRTRALDLASKGKEQEPQDMDKAQDIVADGVTSVHVIPRSNCAFVNFTNGESLQRALEACDGQRLRPLEQTGKPLVCRIRTLADSARTGVGAQAGSGMHRNWVRKQRLEAGGQGAVRTGLKGSSSSSPETPGSTSSSTNSYFLVKHFPTRFFILKVRARHMSLC
jgi:hypothetical protein